MDALQRRARTARLVDFDACCWTHEDLQGCQEEQGCCSSRVVAPLSGAVFETCLVALDIVCLKQIARTRYTIVILQHMWY